MKNRWNQHVEAPRQFHGIAYYKISKFVPSKVPTHPSVKEDGIFHLVNILACYLLVYLLSEAAQYLVIFLVNDMAPFD